MTQPFFGKNIGEKIGIKGQVTTFAIIGILVVILAIGIYLTREFIFTGALEPKFIEVPEQAQGVYNYIQGCYDSVLEDAVTILAGQGGYIELPGDPINVGEFTNYLPFYGSNKVVYWDYKADNNVDYIQVPSIPSMEEEISKYLEQNLLKCLGDFTEYEGFTIKKGNFDVATDIQNDRVVSKLSFPLDLTKGELEFHLDDYYGVLEVPLGDLYTVAKRVYDWEAEDFFLEKKTLDLMSFYDEVPLVRETNDCVPPIWAVSQVQEDLKDILNTNMPYFKIKGTNYELIDKNYTFYEIEAGVEDKEVDANFLYSEIWPFEMRVFPEKNGILKGQSVTESLGEARGIAESFICISTYEFLYDLKYPVLLAFHKDDFTFQFATMVVVDRNKPRVNTDEFPIFDAYDQRFCNEQTEFTVYTVDNTFTDLNDVDLKYQCINHLCDLGRSENGLWKGKVPLCINGRFKGEKEGYHFGVREKSTNLEGDALVVLEPLRELNVDVLISRAGNGEIKEGEKVHIQLEEKNKEYGTFVMYPDTTTVKLIPGVYTAKISLISPTPYTIQEQSYTECFEAPAGAVGGLLGLTEEKCQTITLPEVTVDQLVTGTGEFSFIATENDLMARTVTFYVPYHGVINDASELSKLQNQGGIPPSFK